MIDGRKEALGELLGLLDDFPFWFNIVTAVATGNQK